jgi:hypothetical protein
MNGSPAAPNTEPDPAPDLPAPVDRVVTVRLAPPEAFSLFTEHMRDWWPFVGHSCSDEAAEDVIFEGRVGGSVTERAGDGQRYLWGTLTEWNPPDAFAMRWHPGLPTVAATRLRVCFTACSEGTQVRVVHDGWEARGAQAHIKRDQYDSGWPHTLAAFERAAAAWRAT